MLSIALNKQRYYSTLTISGREQRSLILTFDQHGLPCHFQVSMADDDLVSFKHEQCLSSKHKGLPLAETEFNSKLRLALRTTVLA